MIRIKRPWIPLIIATALLCFACKTEEPEQPATAQAEGAVVETAETVETEAEPHDSAQGWWTRETLGDLSMGMTEGEVRELLGDPDRRTEPLFQGATGQYTSDWDYDGQGLQLRFASDEEAESTWTVASISAVSPSTLSTRRGITPGASEQEVRDAYSDVIDGDESVTGQLVVAGSLYGGVLFDIENSRVERIFIGAAAE